jgi:chromatin segregation and condensation protein Rec8/ScpA/Scc1 (kleisin family)
LEKNIHKNNENKELIVDNFVNIVVKDEDNAIKEISQFIEKIKNKIGEIKSKNIAEGYLDIIRELKNLKLDLV